MQYIALDREKLKALILHIVWRAGRFEGFGLTKLNKALWFAEARAFEAYGKPLTGETFIRDRHGPRSKHLMALCDELEQQGIIASETEKFYDYEAKRYKALQPADHSAFTPEELHLIDWWIAHIGENHTAKSISELSHDYAWQIAGMGDELPLYAFLASRIRPPKSEDEQDWAKQQAAALGLK